MAKHLALLCLVGQSRSLELLLLREDILLASWIVLDPLGRSRSFFRQEMAFLARKTYLAGPLGHNSWDLAFLQACLSVCVS